MRRVNFDEKYKKLDKDSDGWAGGMVIISTEKKKLEAWKKSFLLVGFRLNALYAIFFVCLLLVYFLDFVIIFVLIYFCLQVVMLFRIWFLVVSSTDITWTEFVWYQSTIKFACFSDLSVVVFFFRFLQARSQGQSLTDQCGVSVSVFFVLFRSWFSYWLSADMITWTEYSDQCGASPSQRKAFFYFFCKLKDTCWFLFFLFSSLVWLANLSGIFFHLFLRLINWFEGVSSSSGSDN